MARGRGRASHARTQTRSLVDTRGIVMVKLRAVEREGLKTNIPAFAPGDTVRVMVRVREGEKERLQAFEGICIARRGGAPGDHRSRDARPGATAGVRHRRPSLKREAALWSAGCSIVAGIDEVGRGPLAGPVVAAAVVFPLCAKPIRGLDDSKVLTAPQRERFVVKI